MIKFVTYVLRRPDDYRYTTITEIYKEEDEQHDLIPNQNFYVAKFEADSASESVELANEFIIDKQKNEPLDYIMSEVKSKETGSYISMPDGSKVIIEPQKT